MLSSYYFLNDSFFYYVFIIFKLAAAQISLELIEDCFYQK